MRRGLTVLELLAVIVIIATLLAIATPTIASARRAALISSSTQRLHEIHLAATLYAQDSSTSFEYGTAEEMGLPGLDRIAKNRLGLPLVTWHSPCSSTPADSPRLDYDWGPDSTQEWVSIVSRLKESALLAADMNCNDSTLPSHSPWVRRRGLAVTIGGALLNRYRDGDFGSEAWWE